MFRGFNLSISEDFFEDKDGSFEHYKRVGKIHLDDQRAQYQEDLESYITGNRVISGTKIQREWFPPVEADIFISHSHGDKDIACALAGWIYETFDLKCFIDSTVWGYSKNLLQIMNDDLSNRRDDEDGGVLYDYNSCNLVSQHVNAMLSIALQKMIDSTEAVILLNTSKSIAVHSGYKMKETYSPWIYTELICTEIVRKKSLLAYRDYSFITNDKIIVNESTSLRYVISYEVSLEHLISLSEEDLNNWEDTYSHDMSLIYHHANSIYYGVSTIYRDTSSSYYDNTENGYALDALYWHVCQEELIKAIHEASCLN